VNEPRH